MTTRKRYLVTEQNGAVISRHASITSAVVRAYKFARRVHRWVGVWRGGEILLKMRGT